MTRAMCAHGDRRHATLVLTSMSVGSGGGRTNEPAGGHGHEALIGRSRLRPKRRSGSESRLQTRRRRGTCANGVTFERQVSSSGPRLVVTKSDLATNAISFNDG
jgi:hypothetical protein